MVEHSFGSLNDRLSSLNRNINAKDLTLSESLETITSSTNSQKTTLDQNACQIINKTTTVLDKVKSQTEDQKIIAEKSKNLYAQEVNNIAATCSTAEHKSNSGLDQISKKQPKKPTSKKQQKLQKQNQSSTTADGPYLGFRCGKRSMRKIL